MKISKVNVLAGFSGIAMLSACDQKISENQIAARPNIIYILTDDLGYGDIGCFGQKLIKTPNLDQMAAEGIRFTQHYAGVSVSAPSRCVLMTGMHTGHSFVRGNKQADPYGQIPLPDSIITVAEKLKEAGYATGLIGKWGMGVQNTVGDPQKQGFDFFYGYYCQVHAHNSFPEYLYRNGQKEMLKNEVKYLPEDHWTKGLGGYSTKKVDYSNDLMRDEAIGFIEHHKDMPFFLYLALTIPHDNGEALKGETNEVPSLGDYENEKWDKEQKAYAAMISRCDSYIGQIIGKLKEMGIDSNTIVIFTSDNGPCQIDLFNSNAGFRGIKRDLYEGGIRVPFIARWPGQISAGSETNHPSAFYDFMPTACELAGVTAPKTDGLSYVNALLGKEQKAHEFLYWEIHEWKKKQAVRMGDWKAVINNAGLENDTIELYNLATDVAEKINIADQHPDVLAKMKAMMDKEHVPSSEFAFTREKTAKE